jgi:tetratricopeptide (TPR) repeat protein
VVREARQANAAGTAAALRARWEAVVRADSADRGAQLGLATLARLRYDYDEAERRYERLVRGAPPGDPHALRARLGVAEGREAQGQVRGLEAMLGAVRDAAHAAGDRVAQGEAHFALAHSFAPVHGGPFALAHIDSALRLLPAEAGAERALARCRRSQMLVAVSDAAASDSVAAAMRDVAATTRAGDPRAEGICLRALAIAHQLAGRTAAADSVVRRLEAHRRRTHDRAGLALALGMRFELAQASGDFGTALALLREQRAEARASRSLYMESTSALMAGSLALMLNDPVAAAENVARAVSGFEAAGDSGSAMLARSYRPFVSLRVGDLPRARRETMEVREWARNVGDWSHVVELDRQLASIALAQRDWPVAERALGDATAAARRHGLGAEATTLRYDVGRLALHRGRLDEAEREFAAYLTSRDSTQRLSRYEARVRLADVYARRGDLARAERELRAAGDELDAWRATLPESELRVLAFQASPFQANDRDASVARVLAALAAGGRAGAAFELAERRRARELAERLTRARALDAGERPAPAGPHRALQGAAGAALADNRTALVEFVTGAAGAPTTALVVTRRAGRPAGEAAGNREGPHDDDERAYQLPTAASLVDAVARVAALVEGGADPVAPARALGDALLREVVAGLPPAVTRLVLVPDGPLHRVPWDALRLADGRFVAERFAVSLAPSAGVVAGLRQRSAGREGAPVRLLAYGDPAFAPGAAGGEGAADSYRSAFDSAGGLPRLRASADEARRVARYADAAVVRLREDASAAHLKQAALGGFSVVHFATHALVDDRSMTRTALALAPTAGESGFVGAADLAALALRADLVVLSACRSAGGVVLDGEGIQGLTAPLLGAGARAVVATGWRIGDRSTVALVDDFYQALARGEPVSEALQSAKLAAMRRGAPAAEWAAFTVVGDPSVTVALHAPAWWRPRGTAAAAAAPGAAGPLAAVAVAAGYWLRTRRRRSGDTG